jgi:putative drug exporter of the RND superfamily
MASLLARIGGFSARHRWWVIAAWILLLAVAAFGAVSFSKPTVSSFSISGLKSVETLNTVDREFGGAASGASGTVVFAAPKGDKLTAADEATVARLTASLASIDGVSAATDPFTAQQKTLSPQGRIGYIPVSLKATTASVATQEAIGRAMDSARSSQLEVEASDGLTVVTSASSNQLVGIVLALIILLITFGAFAAAGLPILTALLGLGVSVAGIYAATALVPLNSTAPVLAILLALAVGIDYSLFIVNRHRRQLMEGMSVRDSIPLALGTAGTAVFFAAVTVVIALAGLAVVGVDFLTQMGIAAAAAVIVAMLVALTLTPALLSLFGRFLLSGRARKRLAAGTPKPAPQMAHRWVERIGRHPVAFLAAALIVLVTLATPVLTLRLGLPDDGSDPTSNTDRRAYDLMATGFGAGINGPIVVLAHYSGSAPTAAAVGSLAHTLGEVPDVARVIPSGEHGTSVLLTVIPSSGPSDARTETLVRALRDLPRASAGSPILSITGQTAVAIDVSQRLLDALPLYLGLVAAFAFVLLLVVFRSIVIPLKATLSFLLSLGATLGVVVAVFQWGWLGALFGVDPAGPLLSFLPILIVGVLFGLSMDYEMFLVSGMREQHAHGAESRAAVTEGFSQGAKVVAAAALIMIGVFGNGALNGSETIRPIAFGLAAGVLIDAFVVRMTLVPAVLYLFGRTTWWFPRWLDRVIPRVDIEGASLDRQSPVQAEEPELELVNG